MKRIVLAASAAVMAIATVSAQPLILRQPEELPEIINQDFFENPLTAVEVNDEMLPPELQMDFIQVNDSVVYSMGIIATDSVTETLDDEIALLQDNLADYARSYLGTPYVWGSKGPRTFDCSGFTTWVFRKHGLDIGHGSRNQATKGRRVDLADARVGDLIFFTLPREVGSKRVGHVGMVIEKNDDGSVKFIHASSKGGVKISSYPDNGAYSRRFLQIRRIIDDDDPTAVLASR